MIRILERAIGWNRWYAARSYLRSTLWLIPLTALALEQVTVRLVAAVDKTFYWIPEPATTASAVTGEMDTVVTLTMSFIVFTFGSLLVALQVASGQLTPRIIATTLLQDNVIRFTVGLFVFTLLFAAGARARIENDIPHLTVTLAVLLGVASVTSFLYLIDHTARLLRPVSIVWRVGEHGIEVIESVYPDVIKEPHIPTPERVRHDRPKRTVEHRGRSAIVLAVNLQALVEAARDADGVIEFVHRVGDFVATGETLFRLYGGATTIDDRLLRAQVALGPERTIEQDSTFAFRVIVDVALKALSTAINDPTTAVLAIDQLHRLLRLVGARHLHDDTLLDAERGLRVIFPTPNWDDFVQLTCREIRLYGARNFQVARRLRAMIDDLISVLPEARHPALLRELDLLDRTLARLHDFPEDYALARQPDLQGLGGASLLPPALNDTAPVRLTSAAGENADRN
ncbi:MAG TPA: DUF2254 domain-containing protein [Acetobacteraceae bacterium]|nr:DUF2254 domain-containing protein [Acetobacteraceae bacterium]